MVSQNNNRQRCAMTNKVPDSSKTEYLCASYIISWECKNTPEMQKYGHYNCCEHTQYSTVVNCAVTVLACWPTSLSMYCCGREHKARRCILHIKSSSSYWTWWVKVQDWITDGEDGASCVCSCLLPLDKCLWNVCTMCAAFVHSCIYVWIFIYVENERLMWIHNTIIN